MGDVNDLYQARNRRRKIAFSNGGIGDGFIHPSKRGLQKRELILGWEIKVRLRI